MLQIHSFTFGPFQENTLVLEGANKECILIDPGCYYPEEFTEFKQFIESKKLKPVKLINTHFHLDHVSGNQFVSEQWNLLPTGHKKGTFTLAGNERASAVYGLNYFPSPPINEFIDEGDVLHLAGELFEVLFVPGHSVGHIALVHHQSESVIAGDVLFRESIGRTDLPGGDFEVLKSSIQQKMYALPNNYTVYCGHGPTTTIGHEKANNPFVKPV